MTTRITLALQGGGSHGAYTWGVLDRLLEDEAIEIEAISGASAGAINGAVLAQGYMTGGRAGARENLDAFWKGVTGTTAPATYVMLSHYFSPAQLNPLNLDPLRDLLAKHIDFEGLRRKSKIELFVAATRVRDASLRMFSTRELSVDALLASACLPSFRRAVEIDGEAYWDGALVANPPLSVLVHRCSASNMLVVALSSNREQAPETPSAIRDRLAEISFSSSFATELHAIEFAKAEAQRSAFPIGRLERRLRALRVHIIDSASYMSGLDVASRFNTDPDFIAQLRAEGRKGAEVWLHKLDMGSPSHPQAERSKRRFWSWLPPRPAF